MRKNFGAKHLILPQPVYILGTYNEDGTPNAMRNAAWGGIQQGNTEISVCIGARHRTTQNLLRTGAFTVSPGVRGAGRRLRLCRARLRRGSSE